MQLRFNLESLNFFFKKNQLIVFASILVAVFLLYLPGISAYFVNDDYNWISPTSFNEVLRTFWGGWGHGALYRPITRLIFYLEFIFFKNSPFGYHIISIILQTLICFTFYKLILGFIKDRITALLSLLVCVFYWGNHEVICWFSAQTVLLGALFSLLAIYFFNKYYNSSYKHLFFSSLVFYLVALLSYESSVVVPLLLFLMIRLNGENEGFRKSFFALVPFFALTIIYLIFRYIILKGIPSANDLNFNFFNMTANFTKMLKFQLLTKPEFLILILSGITYSLVKKENLKYILFSIVWVIVSFSPYLVVDGYSGRFSYLSMFGFFILAGVTFTIIFNNRSIVRYIGITIFSGYLIAGGYFTQLNAGYWYEAGEIARTIPIQLKEMYPSFPENSTLIFYDIPLGYQQSGVFLTYFEEVIQSIYSQPVNVIHVAHPFNKNFDESQYLTADNVFKFRYNLEDRKLKPIE